MRYKVQNTVSGEYLDDDVIFLLPNGEVGWFIRDGSYPHYRKFGHQEDFKVINEDCERLQKQLDIAVNTLKCYANPDNWDYNRFTNFFATWKLASDNLGKIKELDNVSR